MENSTENVCSTIRLDDDKERHRLNLDLSTIKTFSPTLHTVKSKIFTDLKYIFRIEAEERLFTVCLKLDGRRSIQLIVDTTCELVDISRDVFGLPYDDKFTISGNEVVKLYKSYYDWEKCMFRCDFTVTRGKGECDEDPYERLSSDLSRLLFNGPAYDVELATSKKVHHAHRALLSARSSVFATMLSPPYAESEGKVTLQDISDEVLTDLLEYIYSGRAKNLPSRAEELLDAADRYAVDPLKTACCRSLFDSLTDSNALSRLMLADRHSCLNLKKKILSYIAQSPHSRLLGSPDYQYITDPALLKQIICAIVSNPC